MDRKSLLGKIRRFYAGVSGPILTVGLLQSVNFAVYDSTRRFLYYNIENPTAEPESRDYLDHDSYWSVAGAGAAAGTVLSVFTSPLLITKTKQQVKGIPLRQAMRLTMRNPFHGFGPHLFTETTNRSIYFCTYEGLKRSVTPPGESASLSVRMMAAAVAGISCWAVLYPCDALRSRLFAADEAFTPREMYARMLEQRGWRTFYRGFAVTTLRAGPVAAAILPVYDLVLEGLNRLPY